MEKADSPRFSELMIAVGEIYDKAPSKAVIRLYWDILKPYTLRDVEDAFQKVLTTRQYPGLPKPAEFLNILSPPRDLEGDARIAFKHFDDRLRIDGAYSNLIFDDPVIVAVVNHFGGLQAYDRITASMSDKEFMFHEKDWCKLYQAYAMRPDRCRSQTLIGIHAHSNQMNGHSTVDDAKALTDDHKWVALPTPNEIPDVDSDDRKLRPIPLSGVTAALSRVKGEEDGKTDK